MYFQKINRKILFICLFFFFFALNLFPLESKIPLNQYILDDWNVINGISNEAVNSISQSRNGLLWLATFNGGIVTFDGLNFEGFDLGRLHLNNMFKVYTDKKDQVWIGRAPGLICVQPDTGEYKLVKLKNQSYFLANAILEDHYSNLWIGGGKSSLICFKEGKYIPYLSNKDKKKMKSISAILLDSFNNLWVTSYDSGLYKVANRKNIKQKINLIKKETSLNALAENKNKDLLIGTDNGLIILGRNGGERLVSIEDGLSYNVVNSLLTDSDGNTFIGTQKGLNKIQFDVNGEIKIDKILFNDSINCLYEGREGSIWIGTENSGLKRLRNPVFKKYSIDDGLPSLSLSIYKDKKKNIWVGSRYGTLYKFSGKKFIPFLNLLPTPENGITSIAENKSGELIIGTLYKGVYVLKKNRLVHLSESQHYFKGGVHFILNDQMDNIWLGSSYGLFKLKGDFIERFEGLNRKPYFSTYDALEIKKGKLMIGSSKGVFIIKENKLLKFQVKKKKIYSLFKDSQGIIWAGSHKFGLFRIDGDNITNITKKNGLTSDTIFSITEDGMGHLWISSSQGIQRISLNLLKDFSDGKIEKIEGVKFGISDGMESDKCTNSSKNGILSFDKDKLWFGTNKGIIEINSSQLKINDVPPGVLIKDVRIDSKKIPFDKLEFWNIKNISFSFSVSTFISPENLRIKYKLFGYDTDWQEIKKFNQRKVSYYNLPEGKYSFKVIASNSHGVWNNEGDTREFVIREFFFQSSRFKLMLLIFILVLIVVSIISVRKFLYYKKTNNKYKSSTLDEEEANKILQKINQQLNLKKIYLEDDISLQNFAKRIDISSHKLSQVINEKMKLSFWDLINSYRIEDAKRMLCRAEKKESTILDIAYEVGFNSNVSFNRAFKKITRLTPTQYRKQKAEKPDTKLTK